MHCAPRCGRGCIRDRYGVPEEAAEAARLAEGARVDFERALALQPDLPAGLVARGLYELWVAPDPDSDLKRGLADLTRALEIAPNDAETHVTVGYTLRRLGDFDTALAHFEQASALTGWLCDQHPLDVTQHRSAGGSRSRSRTVHGALPDRNLGQAGALLHPVP